jgi:hypothetical protein
MFDSMRDEQKLLLNWTGEHKMTSDQKWTEYLFPKAKSSLSIEDE